MSLPAFAFAVFYSLAAVERFCLGFIVPAHKSKQARGLFLNRRRHGFGADGAPTPATSPTAITQTAFTTALSVSIAASVAIPA